MENALTFTDPKSQEMQLLKRTTAPDLTDDEFSMFLQYAKHAGLNPFTKQIYATKRDGRVTYQTSIDAFRARADETGKYAGQQGPLWCGSDGKWVDVWLTKEPPAAAKVGVLRSDFKEPIWAVAKYSEYVQSKKDGGANFMWSKMPANQLAKCAEALALRKAFPENLGGTYTDDEMHQADQPTEPKEPAEPKNVTQRPPEDQAPSKPAELPKTLISESAKSQMVDIMNEMGWTAERQKLAFQKAELVGEQKALDGLSTAYQRFCDQKAAEAMPL